MPKNLWLKWGVIIVAVCGLLWLGGVVLKFLLPYLIWPGGAGVALIVLGVVLEIRKSRAATATGTAPVPGAMSAGTTGPLNDVSAYEAKQAIDELHP